MNIDAGADYQHVTVVNLSRTGTIWFRVDGVDPTVAGAGCLPVPAGSATSMRLVGGGDTVVGLISDSTPDYAVIAGDQPVAIHANGTPMSVYDG